MGAVGSNTVIELSKGPNGPSGPLDATYNPSFSLIERHIRNMAYEMKDNRNCGWTQSHYRKMLIDIRKTINNLLEENNNG